MDPLSDQKRVSPRLLRQCQIYRDAKYKLDPADQRKKGKDARTEDSIAVVAIHV